RGGGGRAGPEFAWTARTGNRAGARTGGRGCAGVHATAHDQQRPRCGVLPWRTRVGADPGNVDATRAWPPPPAVGAALAGAGAAVGNNGPDFLRRARPHSDISDSRKSVDGERMEMERHKR